ncbi:unknown [[Mannheimia] succiniciproducens MBEL55E]|uniref:Uncharacterized protein n=1 Tax=Mannheimia succiniciproducens (strain KCTC 0769BP / MBEL55E) TaxID=221988 RepID=Q65TG7_MANSM|nr:unknown [[Mannheimia] succiniciproducens MBEL55E]
MHNSIKKVRSVFQKFYLTSHHNHSADSKTSGNLTALYHNKLYK